MKNSWRSGEVIIIRYLYSALQRTQRFTKQYKYIYTMTQSTKKYIHTKKERKKNQHLGNRWVFRWHLKTETGGASLVLTGSRFQRQARPHETNVAGLFFFVRGTASLVTSEEERSRRLSSLLPVREYKYDVVSFNITCSI